MCVYHQTVLGPEAVSWLEPNDKRIIADATAGHGGHDLLLIERMPGGGRLVMVDAQEEALAVALSRTRDVADRAGVEIVPIRGNFRRLHELLGERGIEAVDGVIYDQGLNAADLESDLGFSFSHDAPLDMRRGPEAPLSAADLLATLDARGLARLLREYGEEPWADRIARTLVRARVKAPIKRTGDLVRVIEEAVPRGAWPKDIHVATRSMMALRYAVNEDIEAIRDSIAGVVPIMTVGARLVCISFCSLEDRAVKQTMRSLENPCTCPKGFPVCVCERKATLKILTKRAVRPSAAEVAANRRSRSAVMRVAERV
ncbi:MAG: 16S rRNA (cytosine(1402)-N(4))-methyltransferase RsmH [Armatimonadetes bacterium]|nr:16S rRNA (cytosine(1402)-N(4))-methyltransferase RsmH [Armatimonadota bacterium]